KKRGRHLAAQGSDAPPGDGAKSTRAVRRHPRCDVGHRADTVQPDSRELKITLRIAESGISSHLAPCSRSWIYSGSGKKPRAAYGLPAGCHGIIRAGCSLPIWPTTSSGRQKKSSRKSSQRNRTECSPRARNSKEASYRGPA